MRKLRKLRITPRDPTLQESIRDALSAYRSNNKLTNAQLAQRLGVDETTVSKFMGSKQGISVDTLLRAITELEIEIVYNGRIVAAGDLKPGVSPDQLRLFDEESSP